MCRWRYKLTSLKVHHYVVIMFLNIWPKQASIARWNSHLENDHSQKRAKVSWWNDTKQVELKTTSSENELIWLLGLYPCKTNNQLMVKSKHGWTWINKETGTWNVQMLRKSSGRPDLLLRSFSIVSIYLTASVYLFRVHKVHMLCNISHVGWFIINIWY